MLKVNKEAVKENPLWAIQECENLLSLCYTGLQMAIYDESELEAAGLSTVAIQTGAASLCAYCSSVLSYLIGEDLVEAGKS